MEPRLTITRANGKCAVDTNTKEDASIMITVMPAMKDSNFTTVGTLNAALEKYFKGSGPGSKYLDKEAVLKDRITELEKLCDMQKATIEAQGKALQEARETYDKLRKSLKVNYGIYGIPGIQEYADQNPAQKEPEQFQCAGDQKNRRECGVVIPNPENCRGKGNCITCDRICRLLYGVDSPEEPELFICEGALRAASLGSDVCSPSCPHNVQHQRSKDCEKLGCITHSRRCK